MYKFIYAYKIALESGARHIIARPYIDQTHRFEEEGRLAEAFGQCLKAVEILDVWDEEGMLSSDCDVLEIRIKCTVTSDQVECPPGMGMR